jgi:hypothetical protein
MKLTNRKCFLSPAAQWDIKTPGTQLIEDDESELGCTKYE